VVFKNRLRLTCRCGEQVNGKTIGIAGDPVHNLRLGLPVVHRETERNMKRTIAISLLLGSVALQP